MIHVHFPEANLYASIETVNEPVEIAKDLYLLHYYTSSDETDGPMKKISFDARGAWKIGGEETSSTEPLVINSGTDKDSTVDRLVLRKEGDIYTVVEGSILIEQKALDTAMNRVVGFAYSSMWISSQGVILQVDARKVLPKPDSQLQPAPIAALFKFVENKGWQWRLLAGWPLKGRDKDKTFGGQFDQVLKSFAEALPFLAKPTDTIDLVAGGESTGPNALELWTDVRKAQPAQPITKEDLWWRLGINPPVLRIRSAAQASAEGRGVVADNAAFDVLELRPHEVQLRGMPDNYEYAFIQEKKRGGNPEANQGGGTSTGWDLECRLENDSAAPLALRAILTGKAGTDGILASNLVMLPVEAGGESEGVEYPPSIWLREVEGFAHIERKTSEKSSPPAWPSSAILAEGNDVLLSSWLDAGKHKNAPFLDFSLLFDTCDRVELILSVGSGATEPAARLRIWGPAVRVTLGRHATHGLKQPHPELPPYEPLSAAEPIVAAKPVFRPVVFLSKSVAEGWNTAPFAATLKLDDTNRLTLEMEAKEMTLTHWRHPMEHPMAGPVQWAGNDPAANTGLSALRGLIPVQLSPGEISIRPMHGALEVKASGAGSQAQSIASDFAGGTLALVLKDELGGPRAELEYEVGFEPRDGVAAAARLRRRGAPPALDFHWVRSVPKNEDGIKEVPVAMTHVQNRVIGVSEPFELKKLFKGGLTAEATAANSAGDPAETVALKESFEVSKVTYGELPVFSIAVARREDEIVRWTLGKAEGAAGLTLAGLKVMPLAFGKHPSDPAKYRLALELTTSDGTGDRRLPFPGPGRLVLTLAPAANGRDFKIEPGVEGKIVVPALDLFGMLGRGEVTDAQALAAVSSKSLSLHAEGGRLVLRLGKLQYWFDHNQEIFSVQGEQVLALGLGEGAEAEKVLNRLDSPLPAGLRKGADGKLLFELEQKLPGLVLIERLVDIPIPVVAAPPAEALPAPPAGLTLYLAKADGSANTSVGFVPERVGDGWEFAVAGRNGYGPELSLGEGVPITVTNLTRVYLRVERERDVSLEQPRAWSLHSGMIGWSAKDVFGFKTRSGREEPIQVTLRISEDETCQVSLNGALKFSFRETAPGIPAPDQDRIEGEVVFWDASFAVTIDAGGKLQVDWREGPELPLPALLAAKTLSCKKDVVGWCAFFTARLRPGTAPNPARPQLWVEGLFSLEAMLEEKGRSITFRRPDTQLDLWKSPEGLAGTFDMGVVVGVQFSALTDFSTAASISTAPLPSSSLASLFASSTVEWRNFSFGPEAERQSAQESASAFPGSEKLTSLPPAKNGVVIYGAYKELVAKVGGSNPPLFDGRLAGYTLYQQEHDSLTEFFWLRCPVWSAIAGKDPLVNLPCLWIWEEKRLRRIWTLESQVFEKLPLGTPEEVAELRKQLQKLAQQVLALSRWHRGAVLEAPTWYSTATGFVLEAGWELVDSPLLNRSLQLSTLTRSEDPTGEPEFEATSFEYAPLEWADESEMPALNNASKIGVELEGEVRPFKRQQEKGMIAPHLIAGIDVSSPNNVRRAEIKTALVSIGRSVPFELDGKEEFYRWPVLPWLLPAEGEGGYSGGTIPCLPGEMELSLYTPRPGEVVAHSVTATVVDAKTFVRSPTQYFSARTGHGDNDIDGVKLEPPATASRNPLPYRDHLDHIRIAWQQEAAEREVANVNRPVLAFHSPGDEKKQVAGGEAIWFRAGVVLPEPTVPLELVRYFVWFQCLVPPAAAPTVRWQWPDGAVLEHQSSEFGLLLDSNVAGDVEGVGGLNMRLSLTGADDTAWALIIVKVPVAEGVEPITNVVLAGSFPASGEGFATTRRDFRVGNMGIANAARTLPALTAVVRNTVDVPKSALLRGFGPELSAWELIEEKPEEKGVVGWIKRSEFIDTVPAGTMGEWEYSLVVLQGDGTAQKIPA